jgi:hypothetical protein
MESALMPGEVDVKLVQFEDAYGKETYINADRMNYLKFHGQGTTVIHFGTEDIVVVKMEPAQVARKLAGAELDAIGRPHLKGPVLAQLELLARPFVSRSKEERRGERRVGDRRTAGPAGAAGEPPAGDVA